MPKDLTDQTYLRRAIRVAMEGRGLVEPNPMVGCVMVKDGRVIGEGLHRRFGHAHAEPDTLTRCTESPKGATAYVTLEPCCHTDKKTPPCVPQLIKAGVCRVVIGCLDPNPKVNGNGVRQLRAAGIKVVGPVLEGPCKQLIAPFIRRIERRRPYVTIKWAESSNDKVAGAAGARTQISNALSMRTMHGLRSRCDAILVGIHTALNDDPLLLPSARGMGVSPMSSRLQSNSKKDTGETPVVQTEAAGIVSRPIRRVILDTQLRLRVDSQLARTAKSSPVTVITAKENVDTDRAAALRSLGVDIIAAPVIEPIATISRKRFSPGLRMDRILPMLTHAPSTDFWPNATAPDAPITHLLIEPGPTLAASLLHANLVDRVWIYRSSNVIDAPDAPNAAILPPRYVATETLHLEDDALTEYLNSSSNAFYAAEPSADLLIADGRVGAA